MRSRDRERHASRFARRAGEEITPLLAQRKNENGDQAIFASSRCCTAARFITSCRPACWRPCYLSLASCSSCRFSGYCFLCPWLFPLRKMCESTQHRRSRNRRLEANNCAPLQPNITHHAPEKQSDPGRIEPRNASRGSDLTTLAVEQKFFATEHAPIQIFDRLPAFGRAGGGEDFDGSRSFVVGRQAGQRR